MDRKAPTAIIKNGAKHAVQVAPGTKNAQAVRHVVTSDVDAPIEDCIIKSQETPERGTAVLQGGAEEMRQLSTQSSQLVDEDPQAAPTTTAFASEVPSASANSVLLPPSSAADTRASAPIIGHQVHSGEDAFSDKAPHVYEQEVLAQVNVQPAQALHTAPENGQSALVHRQRIEQIQAEANRIRQHSQVAPSEHRVRMEHGVLASPSLVHEAAETGLSQVDWEDPTPEEGVAHSPVGVDVDLPLEVVANMSQTLDVPAPAAKKSDLMARLRAIKSNMSVTENRLSQLDQSNLPEV